MTTIGEAKKGGLLLALFLVVLRCRPANDIALKQRFENSLDKLSRLAVCSLISNALRVSLLKQQPEGLGHGQT